MNGRVPGEFVPAGLDAPPETNEELMQRLIIGAETDDIDAMHDHKCVVLEVPLLVWIGLVQLW